MLKNTSDYKPKQCEYLSNKTIYVLEMCEKVIRMESRKLKSVYCTMGIC